jgi:hypothetical protein
MYLAEEGRVILANIGKLVEREDHGIVETHEQALVG